MKGCTDLLGATVRPYPGAVGSDARQCPASCNERMKRMKELMPLTSCNLPYLIPKEHLWDIILWSTGAK